MITFSVTFITLSISLPSLDAIANIMTIIEGGIGIAIFIKDHFS